MEGETSGGAIHADNFVTVTSTTFSHCRVTTESAGTELAYGGAISSDGITVTASSFTDCLSDQVGGAIFSEHGIVVSMSTFRNCRATTSGGALVSDRGSISVTSSTFTGCTAPEGGAISQGDHHVLPPVSITFSDFSSCSATAGHGGAINILHADPFTVTSSTFTGCSAPAGYGGAIAIGSAESVTITSTRFTICSAADGGAVAGGGNFLTTITTSTFTGCSAAGRGGATLLSTPSILASSTFTGCSAPEGGAIAIDGDDGASINFCCLVGNTAGVAGPAINSTGTVDATNNWWGTNNDPAALVYGPVTTSPWLVLGITAYPSSITIPQSSFIRTNLTYNSEGSDTSIGGIYVPNGITNSYALITGPGMIAPLASGSGNGAAQTTYNTLQPGTANISGTVDSQTLFVTLGIEQGSWTPSPTEEPIGNDWPEGNGGATGGLGAQAGASAFPLMTVTVNIGGDSKAWQAVVTGTKLSDLIVTGTVQHGPGSNMTAPPGITSTLRASCCTARPRTAGKRCRPRSSPRRTERSPSPRSRPGSRSLRLRGRPRLQNRE